MSELTTLLRELGQDPTTAPSPPIGLADRALARSRRRSRQRGRLAIVGAATAAVLVAAGVTTATRLGIVPGPIATATHDLGAAALKPRENVLIIGTDNGKDRTGVRPNTIMVASIDTRTGATALFGLPSNLEHVPFPAGSPQATAYPDGFSCPRNACLLNSLWTWAEGPGAKYYRDDPRAGLTATVQATEQLTGLGVDEWVVLDMRGLANLVDAVGGVTVDVHQRLPIGDGTDKPDGRTAWIEPGIQHFDGYHALWYARSRRLTSDDDRMARQSCLLWAIADQADLRTFVTRFPRLDAVLAGSVTTSVPLTALPAWASVAGRLGQARIQLVSVGVPGQSGHPDLARIHRLVAATIAAKPEPGGAATPTSASRC